MVLVFGFVNRIARLPFANPLYRGYHTIYREMCTLLEEMNLRCQSVSDDLTPNVIAQE